MVRGIFMYNIQSKTGLKRRYKKKAINNGNKTGCANDSAPIIAMVANTLSSHLD